MRTPDIQGLVAHDGNESCTGVCEGPGEALTGVMCSRAIEPRNHGDQGADVVSLTIECSFRSMKSMDIAVRPVRHYLEDRVRAHVFLCVLAAHLLHLAKEKLAELTFRDEDPPLPASPVAKKDVSESAKAKVAKKVNANGDAVMSFRSLLAELDTLTRSTCQIAGTKETFWKISTPTPTQQRAFELIGAKVPVLQ